MPEQECWDPRSFAAGNAGLTSRDGWNDADLVSLFDGCGFFFQEADVLVVDKDIHEAANIPALVADALEEAGE
jgi:hypothetical protein